jgi:hypothetical protein
VVDIGEEGLEDVKRLICVRGSFGSILCVVGFGLTMVFACWLNSGTLIVVQSIANADCRVAIWTGWSREAARKSCIDQNIFFLTASGVDI